MTGMSRTCLVSPGTNGGISVDSHLSSAVYTYDCMHKYAYKELHTYTTLRVHINIQITTHMPAGTNYTREPRVQYISKHSQTCTAMRAQLHIQISYTKFYLLTLHYMLGKTFAGSSLLADVRSIRQYFIYSISQRDSLTCRCLYWEPSIRRIGGSQNKPK